MMGAHHAATGAAAWVALTSTLPHLPAFGTVAMSPAEVAVGAVVCAGAALVPDADHSSATIAHSAGMLSRMATRLVSAGTGGHRNGTHSAVGAIAVLLLAAAFTSQGWISATPWSPYVLGAGMLAAVMLAFSFKVVRLARSWPLAWILGTGVAAAITVWAPALWQWLPLAIAVGWIVHLAGDLLTVGGLPLLWPFAPRPPRWLGPTWFWTSGGYFAIPILGRAGSRREWLLCVPVSLYATAGVVMNLLAAMPFAPPA